MEQINTLQEVINKRAAARLDADLMEVSKFIRGNRLTAATDTPFPYLTFNMLKGEGQDKPKQDTKAPYWVFQYEKSGYGSSISSSAYMDQVRAYWLPKYIAEETANFIKQVDDMQAQADQLAEDVEDLRRSQNQ